METPAHKSLHEDNKNVLMSPWKGKLTIKNCVLCDITLWSTSGTVIPAQLPHILDFRYVIQVSSLKEKLPEAALRKQIYLEERVCSQDVCFNFYEVELSNKQRKEIDKLIEYVENKQLAIIKCLEDRGLFILLSSSALRPEPGIGDEQMGLRALHLFRSPLATEVKVLKTEDDISWKLAPILPGLNYALLEAKKFLPEERTHPNVLVKHNFQELLKVHKSLSLTAGPQNGETETTFCEEVSSRFDTVFPTEKCSAESLTQLKSYFSDSSGYTLEVSTALNLLAEHPPSPYISDGICDAGFSLVMTPDPEFLDSEPEVRKTPRTEKNSEEMFKSKKAAVVPLSAASNLRIQPKRKASMLPILPSKRANLCRPFAKRTTPGTDRRSYSPPTLKLVKGQFPQKRKRGAEVLTAQFVQKSKLNRKNQEVPISKDVPVATNAKRAKKQEKSPVKTVRRAKPPMKKSPQKQRVNIVKGNENPRIKKQLQPAKEETALQLQSGISSDGQKDGININTAQPQSTTVTQKDLPGNSIINYDSQALNMLADLALSSAASPTPLHEARNLPCSSELPQNDALLSKDSSLSGTSDHEYHRGVKSQKGILLPKSSCDQKNNSGSDSTVSQEENSVSCSQIPANAHSALHKETLQPMLQFGASQNTLIIVEHSYALLLGEHSKKHLQQRGLPGPAFTKNGIKGPDTRTPVGKVMPFRHLQHTSPLQKLSEDSLVKRRSRFVSSNLKNIFCSHVVVSRDGSIKITFKCETEYAFNLDSRYTNNPLEKTVVRALHGPWNINLPENVEETKLVLHMWVALLRRNRNEVIQSSRKVVEHSNPAKYVSLNSTLECFELTEIEESSSVERCLVDPLLETNEMSRGHGDEVSFRGPNSLLPLIKLPSSRALELCVHNEQKETFATEYHADSSESQNFICSCNNEIIGGKAKEESTDKLEASNLLSVTGNTQTNGPFISDEDKSFQSLDSKRMISYNTGTQPTFTKTYSESSSQPEMCRKSVYSHLESRVDNLRSAVQTNTSALKDVIQHRSPVHSECQSSLESTDDNMEYVVINLEPVTFTLENNACVPVHTKVSRVENLTAFSSESVKKVSPATNNGHTLSSLEETQTESVRDIPSLAVSGQKSTMYLSASSGKRETPDEEQLSLQKEMPLPISSPSYDKALIMEALSLVKHSSYPSPSEEIKRSQDVCPQAQNLFSISSEEIIEPSQVEEVLPSASASLGKRYSHDPVSPKRNVSDDSLELKNNKSSLSCENMNLESFSSVFAEQTNLSMNGQEVSLELQEENSDIDLTLTISPPTSPRGKVPAKEAEQLQEAPGSNVGLQDIVEITEPEEMTLIEKREMNSASAISSYSTVSKEPLENKERKGDSIQSITLILPKQNCTLEIGEKINTTSDFPFNSLIEEVSPASSPDPLIPTEETWSSQAVPQSSLKLHGTQCEKSNKFSQIESEDLAVTEKENSFVGPNPLVGGKNLTQLPKSQLSAQMPLILTNHPRTKDRLILPDKTTEEIAPSEHSEGLSFSDKVQCHDPELNDAAFVASYGNNFKPSLEKQVKSGNPLQLINRESKNLSLKHLVSESNQPPFSSRKTIENKSLVDTLVSTTALSGTVGLSLKEQGSPESIKRNLYDSDLKTDGGSCIQVKFMNAPSADEIGAKQAHLHPEIPEFGSASDSGAFTQCTRPESIGLGFQTQEISVIRMASLLGNSKTENELHQKDTDLGTISLQPNSTTFTESEQETVHTLSGTSVCEVKELSKDEFLPSDACSYKNTIHTSESISEEPFAACVPESVEILTFGVSKEHIDRKSASKRHKDDMDSDAMGRNVDMSMNPDIRCELLSGESDEDSLDDCGNPRLDMENSGILRSYTRKNEHATEDDYDSLSSLNNSDNEARDYSNEVQGLEISSTPSSWVTGLEKADKCVPRYVQIRDFHGIPRNYDNFTVTREFKDMTRTLHRVKRCPSFTINWGLLSSWTSTWQVTDNPTQNTLDLEYLRFTHKMKQVVKKEGSRQPDLPLQISLRDFPLTKMSEPLVLHPTPRSRSPILVTVLHSDANFSQQQSQYKRSRIPSDVDSTASFCKEGYSHSRNLTNSQRNQNVSFHLNKLKYNSTSKESRNDISLILNEYAEFNKVIMNSNHADLQNKELSRASEEAIYQEMNPSFRRQSASYEDIVTDLCASLHTKLNSVLKKACKSPFFFYLVETEDKLFFSRTKSILRKGGHTETEPQHFCQAFHRMLDTLVVIIRNEDISSHLHEIPSLLMLKHLPGVIFAGVDDPEDVLNDTHQELFRTGGFVVSDDRILETITLAQLKEIVKILEKLNGHGRWKWLLHYRENKKLKEGLRMDSVAHKKNLILRSYQSANIIELLPYHHCDSQSQTKADSLKCLINLQIQHVDARFAIFLTDKHISSEVFGNNGILATDINHFIENIQKVAAPFRSSYW
ncbi:protein FAM208B isoform X1 [Octodon degus]|uniref:Protein FAM208B isoform X1 n=1 Tax=Octodon degus TaxID=10160 RepID=A0A6P3VC70_OCTDE|nr:protein FAM208B isoform X2 [Octodon degus]XP_023575525.1 protein FAM208B isoform X1 [Octodon degus]XP_023575526.1 protein FAM208B isoform X1 [Octodon degus]